MGVSVLGLLVETFAAVGVMVTGDPLVYLGCAAVGALVIILGARRVIKDVQRADPVGFIVTPWLFTVGIARLADGDHRLGTSLVVSGVFFALISAARLTNIAQLLDVGFIVVGLWLGVGAAMAMIYQQQWAAVLALAVAAAIVGIGVVRVSRALRLSISGSRARRAGRQSASPESADG
jgi:hypothetical protein